MSGYEGQPTAEVKTWPEKNPETAEAFANPRVGDRFHEMWSFWMYVVAINGDEVVTMTLCPPGELPRDGKVERYVTADQYRAAFQYKSMAGYWITLDSRDNDISWYPAEVA